MKKSIVSDVLLPLVVALLLSILDFGKRGFIPTALFLSLCEILSHLWINRCEFILLKPVRQASSFVLVPIPAMVLLSIFFPEIDIQEMVVLMIHYATYLGYSLIMIFARPIVNLCLFGLPGDSN